MEEENRELKDRWIRTAAEMENLRKRTERERVQWMQSANADLLKAILPIGDDLERSLQIVRGIRSGGVPVGRRDDRAEAQRASQVPRCDADGAEACLSTWIGMTRSCTRSGKVFRPALVLEEYEKGYLLNGQVLRHAKVVVSK
ncbi:MAG: nucleotide exchange factor GrpE [Ignavibacteriales bacterium]|nr:nucleotide exchange factor GrpE [Ignavibacteriales bacterium]